MNQTLTAQHPYLPGWLRWFDLIAIIRNVMAIDDATADETPDDEYADVDLTDAEREALGESDSDPEGDPDPDDDPEKEADKDDEADEADKTDEADADKGDTDESTPAGTESVEGDTQEAQDQVATDTQADVGNEAATAASTAADQAEQERQAAVKEIAEQRTALNTAYNDGDLDTTEYMDKREALAKQEQEIEWASRKEEIKYEQAQEANVRDWETSSKEFATANPDYFKSLAMQGAIQAHTNAVYADRKFATASHAARLNEAKRRTDVDLGRTEAPAKDEVVVDPKVAADAKKAAMSKRGKQADKVTPTLSDVPPADETSAASGGKYAHLDNLEGVDLERAIAGMSETEHEAWLSSSH